MAILQPSGTRPSLSKIAIPRIGYTTFDMAEIRWPTNPGEQVAEQRLCSACQGINVETLRQPNGYCHSTELEAFLVSADSCHICASMISSKIGTPLEYFREIWKPTSSWQVRRSPQDTSFVEADICDNGLWGDCQDSYDNMLSPTKDSWRVHTLYDDPAEGHGIPALRPLGETTGSQTSFDTARKGIRECCSGHVQPISASGITAVRQWTLQKRPARLLKIVNDRGQNTLQLVDTDEHTKQYATLSYCWGDGSSDVAGEPYCLWMTTRTNVFARRNIIDVSVLPKPLAEACSAARELEMQFIWIDSICIIQDDELDWAREAAKMGTIYANSAICLSALSSESCHDGLFDQHSYNTVAFPARTTRMRGEVRDYPGRLPRLVCQIPDGRASTLVFDESE
jgi:hypothetical protein